jgi:hypothetical protein
LPLEQNQQKILKKRIPQFSGYPFSRHWFDAKGKAVFSFPAIFGSCFGKWLTGTNTPLEISSARESAGVYHKLCK